MDAFICWFERLYLLLRRLPPNNHSVSQVFVYVDAYQNGWGRVVEYSAHVQGIEHRPRGRASAGACTKHSSKGNSLEHGGVFCVVCGQVSVLGVRRLSKVLVECGNVKQTKLKWSFNCRSLFGHGLIVPYMSKITIIRSSNNNQFKTCMSLFSCWHPFLITVLALVAFSMSFNPYL